MLIFFWLNDSSVIVPDVCPPQTFWQKQPESTTAWAVDTPPAIAAWSITDIPSNTQWRDTIEQDLDTWDLATDTWDNAEDTWDSLLVEGGDHDPIDTAWQQITEPTTNWEKEC